MRSEKSGADVPGIKGTGHGGILGALENGGSVGKDGHFIRRNEEAQQKIVLTNAVDEWLQASLENAEVESAGAFVNLDGITAAQGDAGLGFSRKIGEIAPGASAAIRMARHGDGLHAAGPDVTREQAPVKSLGVAGEEFQGFGYLQGGDQIDDGPEHADGVASFLEARGGAAGFEKTGEAGRRGGTNCHRKGGSGGGARGEPKAGGFFGENRGPGERLESGWGSQAGARR